MASSLAPSRAILRTTSDLIVPSEFVLGGTICVIGRDSSCDLVIDKQSVSRQHAQIEWQGRYYVISDAGSVNGTFVNGQQITGTHRLRSLDGIGLANPAAALTFIDLDATVVEQLPLQFIKREHRFVYHNVSLGLSPNLLNLLLHLYTNLGQACSREDCIQAIWKKVYMVDGPALLHKEVSELRQKFKAIDPNHEVIKTVRGFGYMLNIE